MSTVEKIERKIFQKEGVRVKFVQNKRDVRSDKEIDGDYNVERMLKNSASVHTFIDLRLKKAFPNYDFVVLRKDGRVASGNMKLSTVRDTYLDEK